uniref:Peptidase M12A domain-containing protein n=1 Tax=Panagrellus redivivus TaxID=6233 RepID=A0A7E4VD90_PANRE
MRDRYIGINIDIICGLGENTHAIIIKSRKLEWEKLMCGAFRGCEPWLSTEKVIGFEGGGFCDCANSVLSHASLNSKQLYQEMLGYLAYQPDLISRYSGNFKTKPSTAIESNPISPTLTTFKLDYLRISTGFNCSYDACRPYLINKARQKRAPEAIGFKTPVGGNVKMEGNDLNTIIAMSKQPGKDCLNMVSRLEDTKVIHCWTRVDMHCKVLQAAMLARTVVAVVDG